MERESGRITSLSDAVSRLDPIELYGRVSGIKGLLIEIAGPIDAMPIGGRLDIEINEATRVPAEVIGIQQGQALAMPFGSVEGLRRGCRASLS